MHLDVRCLPYFARSVLLSGRMDDFLGGYVHCVQLAYSLPRQSSLKSWAKRMGFVAPALQRLEAGDAAVGIGVVATVLGLVKRAGGLGTLVVPAYGQGVIQRDVRAAFELDRARAQASIRPDFGPSSVHLRSISAKRRRSSPFRRT